MRGVVTAVLTMPLLAGTAVVLRQFRMDDAQLVQKASTDPLIPLITTVPRTPDIAAARAYITRQHSRSEHGVGYSFAIADVNTDRAVGQIGLWLDDVRFGRANLGYWIAAPDRRRGFARDSLTVISEPWNEGSWRQETDVS